jgi:hypothetical protein
VKERGLARSRWTYDADHLALANLEVDAFEHLKGAEGFSDVVELYHCSLMGLMGLME